MSIPKTLFQTWKTKELPFPFSYWASTFKDVNPNFGYTLWDDDDNRRFIEDQYPWFLPTYDAFPAEIYRADAVRYFHLYHFGGAYADLDTEFLQPLDWVCDQGGVVLGRMGTNPGFEHSIPNAMMFSETREEFWLLVFSLMMTADRNKRPEYVTGPVMLKTAHDLYTNDYREDMVQNRLAEMRVKMRPEQAAKTTKSAMRVLPSFSFYPIDWNDRVHDRLLRRPLMQNGQILERETALDLFPISFTVSYWSHSWEPQDHSFPPIKVAQQRT